MGYNIKLTSQQEKIPEPRKILVTDKDILVFSKQILFYLFIAFVLCGIGAVIFKSQSLFEIMKTEIPSAFMLVVGHYLGDKRGKYH